MTNNILPVIDSIFYYWTKWREQKQKDSGDMFRTVWVTSRRHDLSLQDYFWVSPFYCFLTCFSHLCSLLELLSIERPGKSLINLHFSCHTLPTDQRSFGCNESEQDIKEVFKAAGEHAGFRSNPTSLHMTQDHESISRVQ